MGRVAAARIVGVGVALTAALLLSACSMAGLKNFRPLPGNKPAVVAEAAPAPMPRKAAAEAGDTPFVALAFAAEPRMWRPAAATATSTASSPNMPTTTTCGIAGASRGEAREHLQPARPQRPVLGLMQIRHDTAQSMGYRGDAAGLLDAETNLKYAVKYLRGAYVVGGYSQDAAVRHYSRGYYYDAKRQGLLKEVGLR